MTGRNPVVEAGTELRADCSRCFALCCVALPFDASADFAISKPAGTPCPNLTGDHRCGIHRDLRSRGFAGCAVYDCFGAGQRVSQVTFGGRDWRDAPATAREMFAVFPVVRALHELLWYLSEVLARPATGPVHDDARRLSGTTEQMVRGTPGELLGLDVDAHRAVVNDVLLEAGALVRAQAPQPTREHRGADLAGARLHGADLRGASLRGAVLVGADLCDADLRLADVIGADLRGARLAGADLRGAVFLTQAQLDSARGDRRTRLSGALRTPAHWE